jgi:hypothetical protein
VKKTENIWQAATAHLVEQLSKYPKIKGFESSYCCDWEKTTERLKKNATSVQLVEL